ncbi:MAG: hypothetical protein LC754_10340 [Acidobacteria bacterium]|nr:hypothetical protein [Acidobacteriota bacterium]
MEHAKAMYERGDFKTEEAVGEQTSVEPAKWICGHCPFYMPMRSKCHLRDTWVSSTTLACRYYAPANQPEAEEMIRSCTAGERKTAFIARGDFWPIPVTR